MPSNDTHAHAAADATTAAPATSCLGVALYHRLALPELVARCAPALLELLGADATRGLQLWLGDEPRGPATAENLATVELHELTRGRDRALTIAPEGKPRGSAPWALVHDPELVQRRAVRTDLLAAIVPAAAFDRAAFERLCQASDVRYGFATPASSVDAALDEVLWPDAAHRRAPAAERRHPDAWLQLMRSFGRPDIDHGVPDIYWCNALGNLLVNELRRLDCWDELEQLVDLRYLDNGAVVFQLCPEPCAETDPEVAPHARAIGDVLAPVGLMQRVLLQARQGDLLLLEALVATGDPRLLPGLLFPQGLDALRRLAATTMPPATAATADDAAAAPDDLDSLEAARAWLTRTAGQRPRGYGEPRRRAEAAEPEADVPPVPEPGPDTAQPDAAQADAAAGVTAATEAADAERADGDGELAPEPAFDRDSPQWRIDSMTRGALRLDLGSLRWTPAPESQRHFEAALVNDLPCSAVLRSLQAVVLRHGVPHALCRAATARSLAPAGAREMLALDVPAPEPGDELLVQAALSLGVRQSVADILLEDGGLRLLGAAPGREADASLVHDTWPARVLATANGDHRLVLQLTNTMQQPWCRWTVALVAANDPATRFAEAAGAGFVDAGHSTWTALEVPEAATRTAGNLQLLLEAWCELEVALAGFRPRDA